MKAGISVGLFCLLVNTYTLTVQNSPSNLQNNVLSEWPLSTKNQYSLAGNGEGGEDFNWRGGVLSNNGLSDKVQWFVVVLMLYPFM